MSPSSAVINGFLRLLVLSVTAPRIAAAVLRSLNLSRAVLWQTLLLVTILSVLLVALTQGPIPEMPDGAFASIVLTPYTYTVILGSSFVMMVFALQFTGQALGGKGEFEHALILVIWWEVLGMALRVVLAFARLLGPDLHTVASVIGLGMMIWVLINFIDALHDFESLGKSLLTILLAVIGISLGVAVILAAIGVSIPEGNLNV